MQITDLARRVLQLVFALSGSSAALSRPRLERRLDMPRNGLNQAISELSSLGLLDAQRLRLTFPGLAVAVAIEARRTCKPLAVASKASRAVAARAPIALFSPREAPRAVA